jgi:predicted phosphodiesterase
MRFGLIANVHGNLEGLQAALRELDALESGVDRIVCAGDIVGLGPYPNEVVALLRERGIETVRGNYDDAVAFQRMHSGVDFPDRSTEQADHQAVTWTREHLTEENLEFLRKLPRDARLFDVPSGVRVKRNTGDERIEEYRRNFWGRALFGGFANRPSRPTTRRVSRRVLLVHGSPRALNEFVRPDTARSILATVRAQAQADVLLTGHAGIGFQQEQDGGIFIGAGSISGPQAQPGIADFAVVDIAADVNVAFGTATYDVVSFRRAILESGLPQSLTGQFATEPV